MNKLICLILLIPYIAVAQRKKLPPPPSPREPTKSELALMVKHEQCFNSHKYNAKQRLNFFPFNNAVTIKLVSFPFVMDSTQVFIPMATNHFEVNSNKIIESRVLTKTGIDSLTDILYNIGKTPVGKLEIESIVEIKCYEPRNAILFINEEDVVTQYIELCFGCQKYYSSSKKIRTIEYCEQKYDMLRTFFLSQSIQYGTILPKHVD